MRQFTFCLCCFRYFSLSLSDIMAASQRDRDVHSPPATPPLLVFPFSAINSFYLHVNGITPFSGVQLTHWRLWAPWRTCGYGLLLWLMMLIIRIHKHNLLIQITHVFFAPRVTLFQAHSNNMRTSRTIQDLSSLFKLNLFLKS
jgi:hypothetical protein